MAFSLLPSSRDGALSASLCAVCAGATVLWLYLDRLPPTWDDAWYLTNSLAVYDSLSHGGIGGYLTKLNTVFGFKAPLIAALPAPFYLVFGRRWHAAFLVNIASMVILFSSVYGIARRWWNTRAALFAVMIVGTMPLLYGLARWYMVEYALTALLAVSIWLLTESEGLERRALVFLFGATCGFGLLLKISFAAFILPPFLYAWIQSRHRVQALLLAMPPCLLLALPWYASHLGPTIRNVLEAGYGASAANYGTGPIFSLRAIETYLSVVASNGTSIYYLVLAVLLIGWIALRMDGRAFLKDLFQRALLLLWLLPFALFLFGGNKDVRFIAPILPAIALLTGSLLDLAVPRTAIGYAAAYLLLAYPNLQMFSVSFGVPFNSARAGYARQFSRTVWPQDDILTVIAAHSRIRPGERPGLLVGSDRIFFNANNVELSAVAHQLPFDVQATAHEKDWNALQQRLVEASFFLYKEGGEEESPAFNPYFGRLVRYVGEDDRFSEIAYGRRLPDGGVARIFKNSAPHARLVNGAFLSAGVEQPAELSINLGEMIELTGLSVTRMSDILYVKYRWRCLRSPDREYWCFTHILDREGKVIGQLDHRLLDGDPSLRSWRPGDGALEELRFHIPPESSARHLLLRLGLYDPASGIRLRIAAPQGLAASRFSLEDEATALLTRD
jgi:4-amino-4-deoxy-L-arabinose transferase-like glycosyltransferase